MTSYSNSIKARIVVLRQQSIWSKGGSWESKTLNASGEAMKLDDGALGNDLVGAWSTTELLDC